MHFTASKQLHIVLWWNFAEKHWLKRSLWHFHNSPRLSKGSLADLRLSSFQEMKERVKLAWELSAPVWSSSRCLWPGFGTSRSAARWTASRCGTSAGRELLRTRRCRLPKGCGPARLWGGGVKVEEEEGRGTLSSKGEQIFKAPFKTTKGWIKVTVSCGNVDRENWRLFHAVSSCEQKRDNVTQNQTHLYFLAALTSFGGYDTFLRH